MPDTAVRIVVPPTLADFARERRVSFFIGAGFSKNIDSNAPTIADAFRIASTVIGIDPRLLVLHTGGDFALLCEYLAIKGMLESFINQYYSLLHPSNYDPKRVSRAHLLLTEIECQTIFTTNWDFWIEHAFAANTRPHIIIRDIADLVEQKVVFTASSLAGKTPRQLTHQIPPRIVKFHGDFSRRELVIASLASFFDRILNDNPLDVILTADLLVKSFVFIGYGFSDPNIRIIWHKFLSYRRALAAAHRNVSLPPSFLLAVARNPVFEEWLQYLGITVIYVDPAPSKIGASVESLFENIREVQKR